MDNIISAAARILVSQSRNIEFSAVTATKYRITVASTRHLIVEQAFASNQWNSAFLTFSFIIEGASEKVLQYLMPTEPIYKKNLNFNKQKCIL